MGVVFFPSLPFMGVMLFPSSWLGNVFREWGLVRSSPPTPHSLFFVPIFFSSSPSFFIISFSFVFPFFFFFFQRTSHFIFFLFFYFYFFFKSTVFSSNTPATFSSSAPAIFCFFEGIACITFVERIACIVCIDGIAPYDVIEDTTDCNLL